MVTDICPACGYYLYDGECQGCGSVFTEEALKAMSKLAADIDQYPSPQEHVALTNAGWFQHSKDLNDPYPVYYKHGPRYIHILQYKPVGENNWHLSHTYKGGRGASPEGPPLPEPTSHTKLVGEMGENTVGERMKNINVDRTTNPIYDPFIPSRRFTPATLSSRNPGVVRFAASTQTEDLIFDGPTQRPNWFGAPEYKTIREDPTKDESGSVEKIRDADVSVENGVPGRLAVAPIGDHVHAHCPRGHSKATRINVGSYRCDVCGAQWHSKDKTSPKGISWKIGKGKGNQADGLGLDMEGLRPGNWQRVHHDSDEGLEEGWEDEELPPIESNWRKVSEISDDEIHQWMGDLTPGGHTIPNWGDVSDDEYDPQGEKLPWVPQSDHEFLTSRGFRLNDDGEYTKAFNTDYRGGHLHDHTITPHEQGDYEHYVRFNHPDLEDSLDYVGNSAHLSDILENVDRFEQEGKSKNPALFDRSREREFLNSLNSGPEGKYERFL